MGEPTDFQWVYRYTTLASALDIVATGELTLLRPETWLDRNDTHYLEQYRRRRNYAAVYALCFTKAAETSHHWSSFAGGSDGVRLMFKRDALELDLVRSGACRMRDVEYCPIEESEGFAERVEDWPYLKRHPYRGEEEVRALFCCYHGNDRTKRVRLEQGTLHEIVFSPSLPMTLHGNLAQVIGRISKYPIQRIHRSSLLRNDRWIGAVSAGSVLGAADAP